MSRPVAARIAWSLWALSTALLLGALLFTFLNRSTPAVVELSGTIFDVVVSFAMLSFPTVGALVASRRPQNPIGWLFCASGSRLGCRASPGATRPTRWSPLRARSRAPR